LISVVIPVYNAERFLTKTIESFLQQTYKDYELILVNDGSTDSSLSIMRRYENYSQVKILSGENNGAPAARNRGAAVARGEYVLFFDADDYIYEGALAKIQELADSKEDLIVWNFDYVDENGSHLNTFSDIQLSDGIYDVESFDKMRIMMYMPPLPDNKLYKTEIIRNYAIEFDKLKMAQDLNFYGKYLSLCKTVRMCSTPLCAYRIVNGSISHTYSLNCFDIVKSFDYIEAFCNANGCSKEYQDELWNLRIKYYKIHYMNYLCMDDPAKMREVFTFFTRQFKLIREKHSDCLDTEALSVISFALKKWKDRVIYLNPVYLIYRTILNRKSV